MSAPIPPFELRSKYELRALCDRLLGSDPDAVEECVAFLEAETLGLWHGRARALMARRLKHREVLSGQRGRVARAVLGRLARGQFSEGFRDQLRLTLRLDPEGAFAAARACRGSARDHVRRYAEWVLAHEPRTRPATVDPSWRTSTVTALARQMYESRNFGALPILADALQDAGCDSDQVLNHCRDPHAAHVCGCWVVDLVLGKV